MSNESAICAAASTVLLSTSDHAARCYSFARSPRQGYFPPPCKEVAGCGTGSRSGNGLRTKCRCSGMWGPFNLEIVDTVRVPEVVTFVCGESSPALFETSDVWTTAGIARNPPR